MHNEVGDLCGNLAIIGQKTHSFAALTRSFSDTTQSYARIFHEVMFISFPVSECGKYLCWYGKACYAAIVEKNLRKRTTITA